MSRPTIVTKLAVLDFLFGGLFIVWTIQWIGEINWNLLPSREFIWCVAVSGLYGAVGLELLVIGIMLLKMDTKIRWITLLFSGIWVFYILIMAVYQTIYFMKGPPSLLLATDLILPVFFSLLSAVIPGLNVLVLTRPQVNQAFNDLKPPAPVT